MTDNDAANASAKGATASDFETLKSNLNAVLTREIEDCRSVTGLNRLSGGASQETYQVTIATAAGEKRLALRRAPGGAARDIMGRGPSLEGEAALFRQAARAGVPAPTVHYVLRPEDRVGEGFVMEWLDGETLGARINRSEEFAQIRPKLARQCGRILARIHGIDVQASGLDRYLKRLDARRFVTETWSRYQDFETPVPMIDYAGRWLMENLPESNDLCLVHSEFRNGNLMIDPDRGIVAVLDWEGAHIGDPMRDLGWLCTNSWRFGADLPVGGFGSYEDLIAGYESESGKTINIELIRFWEVFGSFWWAVGCLGMAALYRQGIDASVERPAIGRRSSECQIDCVNLLLPGPVEVPAGDTLVLSSNMPRTDELLASVRDFLRTEVMAETRGRTQFLARVAANSVDIVLRELNVGLPFQAWEEEALQDLLKREGTRNDLRLELVKGLRDGTIGLETPGLAEYLRTSVAIQAYIDQPKYSGYKKAMENAKA